MLVIERIWVVQGFPKSELLDLLARCYGVLSTLLEDAHKKRGYIMKTFRTEADRPEIVSDEHLGGRLPCMVAPTEARTVRIHLGRDELITPTHIMVKADPARKEEVLARYEAAEGSLSHREGESIVDWSRRWFEHAKVVLAIDGYHFPTVLLVMPDWRDELQFLNLDDRQALYVLTEQLALHIKRTGAVALIFISECWQGTTSDLEKGIRPSESPNRKEVLQVEVATAEGKLYMHWVEFSRDKEGKIVLGESHFIDMSNQHWGSLEPIRRVWNKE